MTGIRARYPDLVRLTDPVRIVGHHCTACDRRAFPPDPYGCERCGADAGSLDVFEMAGTGVVNAYATVHRHHHPEPETPFTVATIVLDDGITLKGVLDGAGTGVTVGTRVRAVTVPVEIDEDGTQIVDLRFEAI